MHKAELLSLLQRLELHPSRKLGQNFLLDENCLGALVREAAPKSGERILEIGPGTGVLTERLLAAGCQVTAIEYDARLAAFLRERFAGQDALTLIQGDACHADFAALFPEGAPWRCIANLPYSCASVLLAGMNACANPPAAFHVLLQREMAERLTAPPGTREYGVLTARLAFSYRASICRTVPRGGFFPPPEIDSAFLALVRLENAPPPALRARADQIAGIAFAQRRKQARRLLEAAFPHADVPAAFAALGIPADARAEVIAPAQYLKLAASI
jgi:16S rRNA (adenine1518-N6/adenine1519-N6)-dimethyltransferase